MDMAKKAAHRVSRRDRKREAKAREGMLRRTCKNCGHSWVIPKQYVKATRAGIAAGMLGGNVAGASIMAGQKAGMERCVQCGSVGFFTDAPLEAP